MDIRAAGWHSIEGGLGITSLSRIRECLRLLGCNYDRSNLHLV